MSKPVSNESAAIVDALKDFLQTILPSMVAAEVEKQQTVRKATLTVEEAAVYVGVHPDTIRKLIREKVIPHARVAGRIVLRAATLDQVLDRLELESIQIPNRNAS
jgi:excisionase family DNA binding protein